MKTFTFSASGGWLRNIRERIRREQDNQSNVEVDSQAVDEINSQSDEVNIPSEG